MKRVLTGSLLPLLLTFACGGSPDGGGSSTQGPPVTNGEESSLSSPDDDAVPSDEVTKPSGSKAEGGSSGSEDANPGRSNGEGGSSGDESANSDGGTNADDAGDGEGGATGEGGAGEAAGDENGGGGPLAPEPYCGDGIVNGFEFCDDGNEVRGDGCNNDCRQSGRVLDNWLEDKPFEQQLQGAVIVGETLYGVGYSMEGPPGPNARSNKLFVSKDLSNVVPPVSVVDGVPLKDDTLRSIATDGSSFYVVGSVEGANGDDALVEKRTLAGAVQWTRTFDGSAHVDDTARGVAVTGAQLFAVGDVENSLSGTDMFLSQLSRTNSKAPITNYVTSSGKYTDRATSIAPIDGGAIVAGTIRNGDHYEGWLRRVNTTGATVWTTTLWTFPSITKVATGPDGQIAVVGANQVASLVALLDSSGNLQWSKAFNHAGPDHANGVAIDPENGDIIVSGILFDENWDPYVQRLSPAGEERWLWTYDYSTFDDTAGDVVIASDGTIWVVGSWGGEGGDSEYWFGALAP